MFGEDEILPLQEEGDSENKEETPKPPCHTKIAILLFLFLFCTYGYFFQGGRGSCLPQFSLIHSIITRHSLAIDDYNTGADIIAYKGKLYSNKAPGNALLGVLPFYLFWNILLILNIPLWLIEHLSVYLTTVFTTSFLSALIAVMLFFVLLKITNNPVTALLTGLAYGLGTIAFPFATMFFTHQASSFFCFAGFFIAFLAADKSGLRLRGLLLFLSGFLTGYAVVTEYPTFIIVVLITIYLFWKLNRKLLITWFIIGGLISAGILMTYNYLAFKDPFFISYKAYLLTEKRPFTAHNKGFLGVSFPNINFLWIITFSSFRGLFFYNPLLLLMFPGLYFLWKHKEYRKEFYFILAVIIGYFYFNSSYSDNIYSVGGAASTGPRHLIPMIAFAMIPVGIFLNKHKLLFLVLFIPSFVTMLLATSVDPILQYKFFNPIFQFLVPYFSRGDLGIHPYGVFNNVLITNTSVAFNLGILAGLRGTLSLFPLFLLWILLTSFILFDFVRHKFLQTSSAIEIAASIYFILLLLLYIPLVNQKFTYESHVPANESGLIGYYYKGIKWQGKPIHTQRNNIIYFPLKYYSFPVPPPFSVKWEGTIIIPESGRYNFCIESEDGAWLYIDNKLIIDNGGMHPPLIKRNFIELKKGTHKILIKYFNYKGKGTMKLFWTRPGRIEEVIPERYLCVFK